jgi:predicted nuclease with TOPRIM domain
MGITNDSKQAIKQELERLEGQKAIVVARIKALGDKKDSLVAKRDSLTDEISNLKKDLNS